MRRRHRLDHFQAPIDESDDECARCHGDGWVPHRYDMTRQVPCACRDGDWPDPGDREADRGDRRYHELVDEGKM